MGIMRSMFGYTASVIWKQIIRGGSASYGKEDILS